MRLIHYGNTVYSPDKVKNIINSEWRNKPKGGLWTSPVASSYGWKEWCEAESWGDLTASFEVDFTGRILIINSYEDLIDIPFNEDTCPRVDFESLLPDYDAIWLTRQGESDTRHTSPFDLYGWDCECVLVLNKDCLSVKKAPLVMRG